MADGRLRIERPICSYMVTAANPTTVDHRAKAAQLTRIVQTNRGRFLVPKWKTSSQSYTTHKDCDHLAAGVSTPTGITAAYLNEGGQPKLLPANEFRAPVAANDRVALASVALQINFYDDDPATLQQLDSAPSQTLESSAAV
ncbi:hypothetical protein BO79DRAFT_231410 [Aspergillus costaricaensis CBS 115574]|uniref:Uncharacterized protein n=1 Tax=Aspergillus costaricaensis CBS 115574 TaxID=1448317 RepID=A0ACD1I648_9EURO|nr:hypothetical protein BO79DRAFT_231410 [Aspergillus costaricaensis CBS 115574]RAK85480.1 hypothetical protein BO79DRAFT_231410 [Aspergillus costaricaensis CBS 115574]